MAIKVLMRLIVLVSLILAGVTVSAGTPFFDLQTGGSFFGFPDLDLPGASNDDAAGLGIQRQLTTIPLQFIENAGQSDDAVRYMIISDGGSIFFNPDGLAFKLVTSEEDSVVTHLAGYQFVGANPDPEIKGVDRGYGYVNFLVGDDPSEWLTDIPTFRAIEYQELYPGIDLKFEGTADGLKSTYIVAPGVSPDTIVLEYSGIGEITIGTDGALHIKTRAGEIVESPPVCYQETDEGTLGISSSYVLLGNNRVGFSVGPYDASRPLVIDPVMKYGIYLRGIGLAYGRAIAVDGAGNAYVTGESFPAPYTRAEGSFGESGKGTDVVVAKINADGTAPLYVTYFGGNGDEMGKGISIDSAGFAYITGQTDSRDFPTVHPIQDSLGGGTDAFVTKLSPDGSTLVFSTYIGVPRDDSGNAIALDSAGNIYVTGSTWSADFPVKGFSHTTKFGGTQDAFILKMSGNGSQILFSEFLGGSLVDAGNGVAVDSTGNSYVTGVTSSRNFPVKNAIQPTLAGKKLTDAFVTKVNPTGDTLLYSTYLGGSLSESGHGIAVDSLGRAHVTGNTLSKEFPTKNPFQAEEGGCYDAFYTRLSPDGSAMEYSTYLGGINNDEGNGVAIDACDNVYITGFTQSYDFPVIDPYQSKFAGTNDAFVVKFKPLDPTPDYSTFVGGNGKSVGAGIAIHQGTCVGCIGEMTCVYVTGYTDSTNFPSSDPYPVAFEPAGGRGGFVFVLCDPSDCPGPVTPPVANFTYHFECPNPLYVQFTDTSLHNPTTWYWQFGDGTTSSLQHPTHTYGAYGGYNVTLTVSNAGGSSSTTRIFCITECPGPVDPPIANFTYHFECPNPLFVQFTDTSLKDPTSWSWSFGDGTTSSLQHPTHTYSTYGGYNVTLTVSNAGGSSSTTRIFCITECPGPVNPPVANFNYLSQCPNSQNVQFTDTSTGYPTSWSWDFGDSQTSTLQNPTHVYAAIGDYTVTLIATNSAGSSTVTKTVHIADCPGPGGKPVANFNYLSQCPEPRFVQFSDTSTGDPTSWYWSFGDEDYSSLQNPTHSYFSYGSYQVALTVTNEYGSSTTYRTVKIDPCTGPVEPPVADFTFVSQCPNSRNVQFTDASTKSPTSWSWSFGDGQTSTLQNPAHTYSSIGDYTVTLIATNSAGSSTVTKTVHVPDCPGPGTPPVANFNYVAQCPNPLYAQFTDTSTGNPTSWSWSFGDGTTSTLQNPTHTYPGVGGYEITLTVSNAYGSSSISKVLCISCITCPPVANFTFVSQCPNPLYVQFTDTSSKIATEGPTSWMWQFGDGQTSNLQNPTHTYAAIDDYTVTLTASNSAGSNSISKTVHITPCIPEANFTYLSQCPNPLYVQFTDTTSAIVTEKPTAWAWTFGDGQSSTLQNPTHTYSAIGDYNVTLTASNSAGSSTISKIVHIPACAPQANFTILAECPNPLFAQFTDTSTGNPTSWYWQFGDGTTSTLQNPNHTYTAVGGYEITLTASNAGGSSSISKVLCISCITCPPVPNFTFVSVCPNPLYVQFTDTSSKIATEVPTSWSWQFGDGQTSTLQNPTHTYSAIGDYNVTLTASNAGGSKSISRTVHIAPCSPAANFSFVTQCPNPLSVQFTDTSSTIITEKPTAWAWTFGDGQTSTLQNPTHTYSAIGDYNVTLIASNAAGSSTVSKTVHIAPCLPVVNFSFVTQCPNPLYVQFTDTSSTIITEKPTAWSWTFGDGQTSTLQNPTHTYSTIGDYNVTLTGTNAAGSKSVSRTVHIAPCSPAANFSFVTQCPNPLSVQFTDTSSTIITEKPTAWAWTFGDGQTSTLQNPTHTYAALGGYNVTLTASNTAGSSTVSKTVYITPCLPVVNFSFVTQCPNPLSVQFTDTSSTIITEKPTAWSWTFGDGQTSTLQNPTHTYAALGGYNVTLTGTNAAGSKSVSRTVHIAPCSPAANFSFVTQCPNPLSVQFTDTSSTIITEKPTAWAWTFGDGQTSTLQNPTHTYAALGDYNVTLTASNTAGSSTVSKTVHIGPCPPAADFSFVTQCPNPLYVQFTDTSSTIITERPTAWSWTFGDGQTSTLQNPTHTYAALGDYNVTLTASNAAGSSTVSKTVHVAPCPPVVNFNFVSQCPNPLYVQFTDTSSQVITEKPTSWFWLFGDGTTSTLQNPTHTYTAMGDYNVTLTASNAAGSSSISKTVHIGPCPPVVDFTYLSECPNPLYVQFTDASSTVITERPTSWSWNFGDGTTSTFQNPAHTYAAYGDYNVTLTGTNAAGSRSVSKIVHIVKCPDPPIACFWTYPQSGTAPLEVEFCDCSKTNILTWFWDFGDGNTSTESQPIHIYYQPGSYTVSLTVTNATGTDTEIQPDYVVVTSPPPSPPRAYFTTNKNIGAVPLTIAFTDLSTGIPDTWLWNFGDGATSTERSPVHVYTQPGYYTVSLEVKNSLGSSTYTTSSGYIKALTG